MLKNGLGDFLNDEISGRKRFVDLFCGSAAVTWHVAQRYSVPTLACDLQLFSVVLAEAVSSRTEVLSTVDLWSGWLESSSRYVAERPFPLMRKMSKTLVGELRKWCKTEGQGALLVAYGGHYYSPEQATWLDAFRKNLPENPTAQKVCLAALIIAASKAAASPGHTAQPFQPTATALQYLGQSWALNIRDLVQSALADLVLRHAKVLGAAIVGDANVLAEQAMDGDLVFVDPPYSGVQYSRFYHVLESIAAGDAGPVSGVGRYPVPSKRPSSDYSLKSKSESAIDALLEKLADRGAVVMLTFPDHLCSNGLSGDAIREIAAKNFKISEKSVKSVFSTLGGVSSVTAGSRKARQNADELILRLEPI
ncbi:Adenine-specific DNA methylase [Variovorax sp. PDC80]|nr:Adenine-specific DNA methylase [Variovorax sp. PDC80]